MKRDLTSNSQLLTISGLSEAEAAERLRKEGSNVLPSAKPRSVFAIAVEVVREPMLLLLIASGTIYLYLGDLKQAVMLIGWVFVIIGITFYQERKTERALEGLRELSSPRALVVRDGQQKRIAGSEVVRGDILVVTEGDRIAADAVVLSCNNLLIDESLLTGESVPVRKIVWDGVMAMSRPGGDDLPFVYAGTLVTQGQGIARVEAIGIRTEIGKIGKTLEALEPEDTLLQMETRQVVRVFASVGLSVCALIVILYGLTRGNWLNGILAGVTLAMAVLPEEIPMVLTIFLAVGAWRISKRGVLTRRLHAIQALGSATVLCVDKTGTITINRMSVRKIFANGNYHEIGDKAEGPLPEAFHELVEFSILASHRYPSDPMEKSLNELGALSLASTEHLHDDWMLVQQYPLSKALLAMSLVWKSPDGREYVIAAKGAPEAIADLCHLDEAQMRELSKRITSMSDEGLRVIGVARAYFRQDTLPFEQHDFEFEFLGLIGFVDPVRRGVAEAIRECYGAGLRVVMITGDYPGTALNVARQIGLASLGEVITGHELDAMDDSDLQERIREVNIFARVLPEQKLRLVNALKANGEVVVMTGDGVNDAAALKSAQIGIAMGGRGADVAREASALVLLDEDFTSIVEAVRMGRRIFDNLKKAIAYIFAIHVPIVAISLAPVIFLWPLVLLPVHIVFLEMIIDPACSVVFEAEPEEADVMKRPPRSLKEPLFDRRTLILSLLLGAIVSLVVLGVLIISVYRGQGEREARAMTFTSLVIANLALILTNRSWSRTIMATLRTPNAALWWVLGGAVVFLGLVLYVPFLRDVFRFDALPADDLAISLGAGLVGIIWFEALKMFSARRRAEV